MNLTKKLYILFIVSTISSCVSKKKIVYFQKDNIEQNKVSNTYKTIFKPDDLLQITVSALNMDAVKQFNLPATIYATTTNNAVGTPRQQSYLIDNEGYIEFPVIGKIKLGGLSRVKAIDLLKSKLDPDYVKNPTINIRIVNFSITILGDVKKPGKYNIPNERITILEAIGLAGDLNMSGLRTIKIHREEQNQKKIFEIDLRSNTIFSSPAYYLQQNDIIYIEPNRASSQDAAYNKNAGLFISLGSVLISLIAILTR